MTRHFNNQDFFKGFSAVKPSMVDDLLILPSKLSQDDCGEQKIQVKILKARSADNQRVSFQLTWNFDHDS
jgi:hypothetical protein